VTQRLAVGAETQRRAEGEEQQRRAEGGSVDNDDASANMQNGLEWWRARRPLLDEELETTLSGVQVEITDQAIVHSLLSGVRAERQGKKGNIHTKMKGRCSPAEKDEGRGGLDETHEVTGRLASGSVPTMMFDEHTGERILDPYETYAVVLDPLDPLDQEFGIEKRVVNVRGCNLRLRQSSCPIESFQLTRYRHANSLKQTKYNALGSSNRGKIKAKGKGGLRSAFGGSGGVFESGGSRQTAGVFKGQIKVLLGTDSPAVVDKRLEEMLRPQNYIIRCYFLTVQQLAKKDKDVFGRDEASDPYLKGKIGQGRGSSSSRDGRWRRNLGFGGRGPKGLESASDDGGDVRSFNDRAHFLEDVEDEGDYHRMVQLQCTLPGASKLEISCMDYDRFCLDPDDLIGSTVIDLEDRVFDQRWRQWDKKHWEQYTGAASVGSGGNGSGSTSGGGANNARQDKSSKYKGYADSKPIETRTLRLPTSTQSQGRLTMWLDIMTHAEARLSPPIDISLPAEEIYEVRVVVWQARGVVPGDDVTMMNDLFVKCWIGDKAKVKPKTTDIHWRCQPKRGEKGCAGSFNYRLLFPYRLGRRTWQEGKLHVQLVDKDVLKWDDYLGEGTYDMGPRFEQAYNIMAWRHNNPKTVEALGRHLETLGVPTDAAMRYASALSGHGYKMEADLARLHGAEWEMIGISERHRKLVEQAHKGAPVDHTKETEAKAKKWARGGIRGLVSGGPTSGGPSSRGAARSPIANTSHVSGSPQPDSLAKLTWEQREEIVQVFERFCTGQYVQVWLPSSSKESSKASSKASSSGSSNGSSSRSMHTSKTKSGAWHPGRVTVVTKVRGGAARKECSQCHRFHGVCYNVVYGEDNADTERATTANRRRGRGRGTVVTSVCPFHIRSHCRGGMRRKKKKQKRGVRNQRGAGGGQKQGQKKDVAQEKVDGGEDEDSGGLLIDSGGLVVTPSMNDGGPPQSARCCCGSSRPRPTLFGSIKDDAYEELVEQRMGSEEEFDDQEEEEELDEFVQTLSSAFDELVPGRARGVDPPHSEWLPCTKNKKGVIERTGEVCISVEIVPRRIADAMKLGHGREEPNHSPFLPPPVGRMKFSADPLKLLQQVIGSDLADYLSNWASCCICLAIATLVIVVLGPLIQIAFKIFTDITAAGNLLGIGGWGALVVLGVLLLLVAMCTACLSRPQGRAACMRAALGAFRCCCPRIRTGV
jgi:hypothetical protein